VNRYLPVDQDIEHFVYAGGTWSTHTRHVIPQLTDIAMAPHGRSLIALTRDSINEISLLDGMFMPVPHADNPDPFCGGFFDHLAAADNGKFFVVFDLTGCSGFTPTYLYDMLTSRWRRSPRCTTQRSARARMAVEIYDLDGRCSRARCIRC
jgi:hypothetical protein